jgi:hypothetical protein
MVVRLRGGDMNQSLLTYGTLVQMQAQMHIQVRAAHFTRW